MGYHKALEIGRMLCAAISVFTVCIDNTSLAAHMHCEIFGGGFLWEGKWVQGIEKKKDLIEFEYGSRSSEGDLRELYYKAVQ